MKSKLSRQKEQEEAITAQAQSLDIEAVLREKYAVKEAPMPTAKSPVGKQAATKPKYKTAKEPPEAQNRKLVRVSVDFPRPLYEAVVRETDEHAQTIREFMLTLVRRYFEQKG